MKVSTKGQVTIPLHVREALGLLPNTHVIFVINGDEVHIRKAPPPSSSLSRGGSLVARLKGRATSGLSTEEIMALTRADDDQTP